MDSNPVQSNISYIVKALLWLIMHIDVKDGTSGTLADVLGPLRSLDFGFELMSVLF